MYNSGVSRLKPHGKGFERPRKSVCPASPISASHLVNTEREQRRLGSPSRELNQRRGVPNLGPSRVATAKARQELPYPTHDIDTNMFQCLGSCYPRFWLYTAKLSRRTPHLNLRSIILLT